MSGRWFVVGAGVICLAGCGGVQSALVPAGVEAAQIHLLSWVLFGGAGVIFVGVMGLIAWACLAKGDKERRAPQRLLIIGGGIVFPVVTLLALLIYAIPIMSVRSQTVAGNGGTPGVLRIEVIGERWWWRVNYLDEDGGIAAMGANEVRIPVGRPVELVLKSADVIHSFWVPALAGKMDMIPGRINSLPVLATEAGTWRGQCAEFYGGAHAQMAFFVVALAPDEFERWFDRIQRPQVAEPASPALATGRSAFLAAGCGACHRVAGTPADGLIGPDLTHVGGRISIGAGIMPTSVGTLAGWIANPRHLKPENHMPAFDILPGAELRTIAHWLASLT